MTSKTITHIRNFVLLALIQVFIFSQIHLFGYATACIFLIFLLKLPRHTTKNEMIIWGFLFGIVTDMFCNTPGIHAAAAAKEAVVGKLSLEHIAKFEKEIADAGIETETVSPKLLPDYTRKVNG